MNKFLFGLALTAIALPMAHAQDEFDDIYYNPKAKQTAKETKKSAKKESAYIADFSEMDVDDYNRRGFYYESEVDTIGQAVENAEDFIYTQQIQKYYNPTVVVDNADVLADILNDSYGNVEIVVDNGYPTFASIYTGGYVWAPSYYNWCLRPSWTWNYAWGPVSWTWNWGPAWAWGPSWTWSYGPAWSYGPGWGWGPGWGYAPPRPPRPGYYASYNRPGAGHPYAPNGGWANNTRPGGNYNGTVAGHPGSRPMGKPAAGNASSVVSNRPGHRTQPSTLPTRGDRVSGTRMNSGSRATVNKQVQTNRTGALSEKNTGVKTNTGSAKTNTGVRKGSGTVNNARTTTSTKSYTNSSRSTNNRGTNNRSYNTNSNRSYNSGSSRSSGGGSYRGGGGGSRGGGGHRGGSGRR